MDRAAQHHRERLSEALREEIASIIEGELGDPRIGLATVTEVRLSPEGKAAVVLVTVVGDDAEAGRTLQGLTAARNYIRHEAGERLRLRHAPDLHFQLDKSEEYGARIDQLLERMKKRKK